VYGYNPPVQPGSVTGDGIAAALASAGLSVAGRDVGWLTPLGKPASVQYASSVPQPLTFPQQQAVDAYLATCGYTATYPMTTTAPATAAVGSTVTVTADTGDATYTGPVDFYVGGVLQASPNAVNGVASCSVTSGSSGSVTVYGWVAAYGYDSATVTFQ